MERQMSLSINKYFKIILIMFIFFGLSTSFAQNKNVQTLNFSHGKYVGEVVGGKAHGQGTYTAAKTGLIYSGQFVNNTFSGQGTMTWTNGDKFIGTWQNDSAVSGVMTFANNKTASGTVRNGVFKESVSFPKEVIGNWGDKQGCIAEVTETDFVIGGIIFCPLRTIDNSKDGFIANTFNCSADGNKTNRSSIKYDGVNLIVDGVQYRRCKP
jgi:hypothetical protein